MREGDRGKCEERANAEERLRLRERGTKWEEEMARHAREVAVTRGREELSALYLRGISRARMPRYMYFVGCDIAL